MAHGDGGKGSGRRKEDASKVRDNWDLIWGKKKEQPMIDDDGEHIEDDAEDGEYDDTCTWCGGCGEGDYDGASCRHCHGTGIEPRERDCDDSDY
jgi:hypothetical protein